MGDLSRVHNGLWLYQFYNKFSRKNRILWPGTRVNESVLELQDLLPLFSLLFMTKPFIQRHINSSTYRDGRLKTVLKGDNVFYSFLIRLVPFIFIFFVRHIV